MTLREVTVLWENSAVSDPREFGPHKLLKACVFDKKDGDRVALEKALKDCRPRNGAQNVLNDCTNEDITGAGNGVLAVFDGDHVAEMLKMPKDSSEDEIKKEILVAQSDPENLRVVFIHKNIETLIKAASECDESKVLDSGHLEKALKKENRLYRDLVFKEASKERNRPLRDCIQKKIPSFKRIVEETSKLLGFD